MMSLATPWVFGVAVAAALATVALHLLSVRRPPSMMLPTMRFLPDRTVRAVSRTTRPSDLLLMLIRVCALLLAGLALAGLSWHPAANVRGRVVIVDRGRSVGDIAAWHKIVAQHLGAQSAGINGAVELRVVLADSASRMFNANESARFAVDSLSPVPVRTSLAGAMLTALRAAEDITRENARVDSVELVVVSAMPRESIDEAVAPLRAQWPGRISIESVPVTTVVGSGSVQLQAIGASDDDAVIAAARTFAGSAIGEAQSRTVVVNRDSIANEKAASTTPNTIRVSWPLNGVPTGWARTNADTIGAVVVNNHAVVAPFVRVASAPSALAKDVRVIAWWSDGRAAAVERTVADGCERIVGILAPSRGDALLGQAAQPLLSALLGPCGGARDTVTMADTWREQFSKTGSLAAVDAFNRAGQSRSLLAPWLLAAALILLGGEWWWRERSA